MKTLRRNIVLDQIVETDTAYNRCQTGFCITDVSMKLLAGHHDHRRRGSVFQAIYISFDKVTLAPEPLRILFVSASLKGRSRRPLGLDTIPFRPACSDLGADRWRACENVLRM
jgi:hypothetical protein